MAKELHCVIEGCDATVVGDSEADVMAQVEDHAAEAHPDLELDEETVEMVRSHIQDA